MFVNPVCVSICITIRAVCGSVFPSGFYSVKLHGKLHNMQMGNVTLTDLYLCMILYLIFVLNLGALSQW